MFRTVLAALMLVLLPLQAWAITDVTASPGTAYVQGNGAGLVTVRWTIEIDVSGDQTVTITSTGGTLVAGAAPTTTTGGVLRRTVRLSTGTHLVRITERLRIDRTSARHILEGSGGSFTRVFTSSLGGTGLETISLAARASGSGGLTLQSLDLTFDDGSSFRTATLGAALTARVGLSTSGRGIIKGKWEIAGPNGGFRTFRRVNITAGGPSRALVESPPLPTDQPGQFRLRFIPDGDGDGFGDKEITFVVGSAKGPGAIGLRVPAEGAALASRTRFRWDAVPGAARYRVEFLNEADLQPLAAVEAAQATAVVRSFTLDRLSSGATLVWRVIALDESGQIIARSAQRRIGAP